MQNHPAAQPSPRTYVRDGVDCFLDTSRGFLVKATPEEGVRQRTVVWLTKTIGVPNHLIRTEFNHRRHGGEGRSDILVLRPGHSASRAVLVIECKRPDYFLDERTREQVENYAAQVNARYCIVTNGHDVIALARSRQSWRVLEKTPRWNDMLTGRAPKWAKESVGDRWPLEDYNSRQKVLARLGDSADILDSIVGADSEWYVASFACNLYDLLVYEKNALPRPVADDSIVLKKDLGIHDRSFGNVAGGKWSSRFYRSFLVYDKKRSSHQVVSLLVAASMKVQGDPMFGNRKGRTYLLVAIDEGAMSHLSLEACLDRSVLEADVKRGEVTLVHNGALTAGRGGAVKRDRVLAFVHDRAPYLAGDGGVVLGRLRCNKLIDWPSATDFLRRTIRYALVRDEFRASTQRKGSGV